MATLAELRDIANNGPLDEASKSKNAKISPLKTGLVIGASVLAAPFVLAIGLISTPIFLLYSGILEKAILTSDQLYECDETEMKEICKQINDVSDSLIKLQRSSKNQNTVYKHHKNESFGAVVNNKFTKNDPISLFNSGKKVFPYRCVMYFATDCVENYTELNEKAPVKNDIYNDDNQEYYYDAQASCRDDMYDHLAKLGFVDKSKQIASHSEKYPKVEVWWKDTADGQWVIVRANTNRRNIVKIKESKSPLSDLRKLSKK